MRVFSFNLKAIPTLKLPVGRTALSFDASWLVVVPAAVWAIAELYVPIVAPASSRFDAFETALVITAVILLSLVGHAAAHIATARVLGGKVPARIAMFPLGDTAQSWEPAPSAWREAAVALAGPLFHGVLAVAALLVWMAQPGAFWESVSFFLVFFNMLLAAVNLSPAFPFDGGRLVRAICWGLLGNERLGLRLAKLMGFLLPLALVGWGIFLLVERTRVSMQSGPATFVVAGLVVLGLLHKSPAQVWTVQAQRKTGVVSQLSGAFAALLILALAGITASLVPTNYGLEAPGAALSVEPMVTVPADRRYPMSGSFYLTTVIPQTPIILGEWVYAHIDRSIRIVPPETIVPRDRTPQAFAREQFRALQDSEALAVVVGLRLASYDVPVNSIGVQVVSVVADAPARGILQAGDVIKSVDGKAVTTTERLIESLRAYRVGDTVQLQVLRRGETQTLSATLGAPTQPGGAPRLGIAITPAITGYSFPFTVTIVPQKTSGGPSAGLMFTLTVHDLTTPDDLTQGHKIAGTGTIDLDGNVGPIGGVQQKVVAAERAGAEYFLSPTDNYDDAVAMARKIKVVKVATAQEAIDFLKGLPPLR